MACLSVTSSGKRCKIKTENCFCHLHKSSKMTFVCVVCREDAKDPIKLECSHVYCRECMDGWVEHHNITCPQCRQSSHILRYMHLNVLKKNENYVVDDFMAILSEEVVNYVCTFICDKENCVLLLHKLIMKAFFYKEVLVCHYPDFYEQLQIQLVSHKGNMCPKLYTNLMYMLTLN
jgi:hypothetical protein